jgi:hypothetical protein
MKRASLVGFLLALAPSSVVLAYCDYGLTVAVDPAEWGMPVADPTRPPLPDHFTDEPGQVFHHPGIKGLWPGQKLMCVDFKKNFDGFWGSKEEHARRERLGVFNGVRADCSHTPDGESAWKLSALTHAPNGDVGLAGTLLGQKSFFNVTFERAKVKKFTITMCEASASKVINLLTKGSQREKDANRKARQTLAAQTIDFLTDKWGPPHTSEVDLQVTLSSRLNDSWKSSTWKFKKSVVTFYPGGLTLEVEAVAPKVNIKAKDF